jgi:hypothetical protein
MVNVPKERRTFCKSPKCRKHTVHKVAQVRNFRSCRTTCAIDLRSDGLCVLVCYPVRMTGAFSALLRYAMFVATLQCFSPCSTRLARRPTSHKVDDVTIGSSRVTVVRQSQCSRRRPRRQRRSRCEWNARNANTRCNCHSNDASTSRLVPTSQAASPRSKQVAGSYSCTQ